jgi:thiamine kinase-like enzyme
MEVTRLYKYKHSENKNEKYYITRCNENIKTDLNTLDWLEIKNILKFKNDIYILNGILEKKKDIVVKIGNSDSIKKEYEIGRQLKEIHGFVKYICQFSCNNENIKNIDIHKSLCSTYGDKTKILLMPYYSLGSLENYKWDKNNFYILKSLLKQLFLSFITAYEKYGFLHNDTHPGNFLIKNTIYNTVTYEMDNKQYNINTEGFQIVIMDFENSLFTNISQGYYFFYMSFQQIINDIEYKLKINCNGIKPLLDFIDIYKNNNKKIEDINTLLLLIDKLDYINKIEIKNLVYNPYNI